jgi:hypothetical protein
LVATDLGTLDFSALLRILSSCELKIESEDWLFGIFWSFLDRDLNFFSLLGFVQFEFVSVAVMRRFVSDSCGFFDFLNSSVWSGLCRRLALPVSPDMRNKRLAVRETTFSPNCDSSLSGVIWYLTSKFGGMFTTKALSAPLRAARIADTKRRMQPILAISFHISSPTTRRIRGFCYDFKEIQIAPTHYSILSSHSSPSHRPKCGAWKCQMTGRNGLKFIEEPASTI